MPDLDRIEHMLATKALDSTTFERCAQDLLSQVFPGLTPIPGGTDWGRDADISGLEPPLRLHATTSRTLGGILQNMRSGLQSMRDHEVSVDRIILANPARLTNLDRQKLVEAASREGVSLDSSDVFDRGFFASKLRRDGFWRSKLLGLSSEPITLSRVSPELAERPWSGLPLIGRTDELEALPGVDGDIVLTGPPGVGKTRLLQELPEIVFVDKDAGLEQIFDDLRWLAPRIVVVDDAGRSEELIRRLLWARNSEPDVFHFKLIAVCWPDEAEIIDAWFPEVTLFKVDLLEREAINELVIAMGIKGLIARGEILAQAEGRPGWAIALGDTLVRSKDFQSLKQGAALFGQVTKFLARGGMEPEALDILAYVAALGGITEREIGQLATEFNLSPLAISKLIGKTAVSGLIDVSRHYVEGDWVRFYQLRPPMLADVVVAERVYGATAPAFDLQSLSQRWPGRIEAIAKSAVRSALLNVPGSRNPASRLFRIAWQSTQIYPDAKNELAKEYAGIDRSFAEEVLGLLRTDYETALLAAAEPRSIEPILHTASLLARRYQFDGAVTLLLDAALADPRETNPNPGHPLRQLEEVVHKFHPELRMPSEPRYLVARVSEEWLGDEPTPERWRVFAKQIENVLSLKLSASLFAPEDPRQLTWIETMVEPEEIERLYAEIWPRVLQRLSAAPASVVRGAIASVGQLKPFGVSQPPESVDAARAYRKKMLLELADFVQGKAGLQVYLANLAQQYDVELSMGPLDEEVFFKDIERGDSWEQAIAELDESISALASPWANQPPVEVVSHLVDLREQLELAGLAWPDRIGMAASSVAKRCQNPLAWIDAAHEHRLFSEASPFIERCYELDQDLGEVRIGRLLEDSRARWVVIDAVLRLGSISERRGVIHLLQGGDYKPLWVLFLREQLEEDVIKLLLTDATISMRPIVAAAMFFGIRTSDGARLPEALEADWLQAIELLDMASIPVLQDYEKKMLVEYLATEHPDALENILTAALQRAIETRRFDDGLSPGAWNEIHKLPRGAKDRLWGRFRGESGIRWLLGKHLVGDDRDWLEHAVNNELMTPAEAIEAYNEMGPHLLIEQMARILVPRGISPEQVALLAQLGSYSGEESERYGQLVDEFRELVDSDDESVAAVGNAGVTIYEEERMKAQEVERQKRIRGEL